MNISGAGFLYEAGKVEFFSDIQTKNVENQYSCSKSVQMDQG
jgi:hypothetical protein